MIRAEIKIGAVIEQRRRGRPIERAVIAQVHRKDRHANVRYADGRRGTITFADLRYWIAIPTVTDPTGGTGRFSVDGQAHADAMRALSGDAA